MSLLEPSMRRGDMDPNIYDYHSRNRTYSTSTFTYENQNSSYLGQPYNNSYHTRNTPSTNTFSSGSSMGPPPPSSSSGYRPAQSSGDIRRSTSSGSGASVVVSRASAGYVALLRKQKATVWCDRPQSEDPRILAQRSYDRARAQQELWEGLGGSAGYSSMTVTSAGRTGTGLGSNRKIRHTKATVHDYIPGENHVGAGGVPMRLSATEVEGESSDDEDGSSKLHHRRTGSSGRSSIGSGRRSAAYRSGGGLGGSQSSKRRSPDGTPDGAGSLAEERLEEVTDDGRPPSFKSGDEAEMMDNLGELGGAPRLASKSQMHAAMAREKNSSRSIEELKRRGSVDERTTSLTGTGRLFIANPD